jgi:uncharacterized caspase-like protein
MRSLLRPLAVLLCLMAGGQSPAWAETHGARVALVIGNGAYATVGRLANPGNDATLMAQTLKAAGFTLIGGGAEIDLDKSHFDRAIAEFGRAIAGADVALFYYSGHGLQVDGTNFLVPVDANPSRRQDLDFQMVSADLVLHQMSGSGTKLNIIVLDACRNNPFEGTGLRSAGGGLAEMKAPEGTLISYATQPGSVARDGVGRDSPYTLALADAIRQPGLDIFRLFNRVGLDVKKTTDGQQQPWLAASPIEGDFAFTGAATAPPPAAAPAPAPEPATAAKTATLAPPAATTKLAAAAVPLRQEAPPANGFRCPANGAVVSGRDAIFEWSGDDVRVRKHTLTWAWRSLGADPGNPNLCIHSGSVGLVHRLVGWFDPDKSDFADDPAQPMLALLSGKTDQIVVRGQTKGRLLIHTTTWKLHGHASLQVGAQTYDTLVFDLTEATNHNSFAAEGRVWFAPALGMFVQKIIRRTNSADVLGWTITGVAAAGTSNEDANTDTEQ